MDAPSLAFKVPADKLAAFDSLLDSLTRPGAQPTARDIARLAGRLVSFAPAVSETPLHARTLLRDLNGHGGWDAALPSPGELLQQARVARQILGLRNGKASWRARARLRVRLITDASDHGSGAFLPDRELGAGSEMAVAFTPQQLAAMAAGRFSSTERELTAMLAALRWIIQRAPDLLQGRTLHYYTDSQTSTFSLLGLKGAANGLRLVKDIYETLAALDAELAVTWQPRDHPEQQLADHFSKVEDASQWSLDGGEYQRLIGPTGITGGRQPVFDLFADDSNCKVQPAQGRFFALYDTPTAAGVDALQHSWSQHAADLADVRGRPGLLYAYPPWSSIGQVLRKVLAEKVDVLLILPEWPRYWQGLRADLPIRGKARLRTGSATPGPRVPAAARRPVDYAMEACYVTFS